MFPVFIFTFLIVVSRKSRVLPKLSDSLNLVGIYYKTTKHFTNLLTVNFEPKHSTFQPFLCSFSWFVILLSCEVAQLQTKMSIMFISVPVF